MKLTLHEIHEVPVIWPKVARYISQANERGGILYDPGDILHSLVRGEFQLWTASDDSEIYACAVTRLGQFPRSKICQVLWIGGKNIKSWVALQDELGIWAGGQGCDAIEGIGRGGWKRVLDKFGWYPVYTTYRKMLNVSKTP